MRPFILPLPTLLLYKPRPPCFPLTHIPFLIFDQLAHRHSELRILRCDLAYAAQTLLPVDDCCGIDQGSGRPGLGIWDWLGWFGASSETGVWRVLSLLRLLLWGGFLDLEGLLLVVPFFRLLETSQCSQDGVEVHIGRGSIMIRHVEVEIVLLNSGLRGCWYFQHVHVNDHGMSFDSVARSIVERVVMHKSKSCTA